MKIVSLGDNLHEVPDPIFLGKIRKMSLKLSSAESDLVSVNFIMKTKQKKMLLLNFLCTNCSDHNKLVEVIQ